MPQRSHRFTTGTLGLALIAAALTVLAVLPNRRRRVRVAPRRLAASLAFATLFFAGAAFSAGAGNEVTQLLESGDEPAAAMQAESTTTSTEEDPAAVEDAAAPDQTGGRMEEPEEGPAAEAEAPAADTETPAAATPEPESSGQAAGNAWESRNEPAAAPSEAGESSNSSPAKLTRWEIRQNGFRRSAPPVLAPRPLSTGELSQRDPEVDEPGVTATIWLHRTMPDPTPPARRLKASFARQLTAHSARAGVDWALVLGVLRASGERGTQPASPTRLRTLSNRLAKLGASRSPWSAVLALQGHTAFADRAIALQRYNRAVGIRGLVNGLEWARPLIANRVLRDSRISIYSGGRHDIQSGKTNIRILVLLAYLAEAHGSLTVSSLTTGHRLYSRPGVISAHSYGLAADVSALGGLSIMGNSRPGGLTEQGVRNILLLPTELQPRQVISLLGMGGPSFPMGNHDDHIHVGY